MFLVPDHMKSCYQPCVGFGEAKVNSYGWSESCQYVYSFEVQITEHASAVRHPTIVCNRRQLMQNTENKTVSFLRHSFHTPHLTSQMSDCQSKPPGQIRRGKGSVKSVLLRP